MTQDPGPLKQPPDAGHSRLLQSGSDKFQFQVDDDRAPAEELSEAVPTSSESPVKSSGTRAALPAIYTSRGPISASARVLNSIARAS